MESERGDYRRIAERRVRLGLLLSEIGQRNSISVSQAEMNRLIGQEAARYPGEQQKVVKFLQENPMALAQLRAPLYEDKVVDFLIGKSELTERSVTRAELEAAIEDEDETPGSGHVHGPDCGHDHVAAKPKKAGKAKVVATEAPAEVVVEAPAKKAAKTKPVKADTASVVTAPVEPVAEVAVATEKAAKPKRAAKKSAE